MEADYENIIWKKRTGPINNRGTLFDASIIYSKHVPIIELGGSDSVQWWCNDGSMYGDSLALDINRSIAFFKSITIAIIRST